MAGNYIRWLGHSCFEIFIDGTKIIMDPYLSEKGGASARMVPPACLVEDVYRLDLMVITHDHFDHNNVETVVPLYKGTGATIVTNTDVSKHLTSIGIPANKIETVNIKESKKFYGINVTGVKANHPQSRYPMGYLLESPSGVIYHAGDTYLFGMEETFKEVASKYPTYAFLPIGGTYTMDPVEAARAAVLIKPNYVLPMHYDTFADIDVNPENFARTLTQMDPSIEPKVLKIGETIEF